MKPWRITFEGQVWTSDQIPAAHSIAVAALLPSGMGFDIGPFDGPQQLCAWLSVLVASSRITLDNVDEIESMVGEAMQEVSQLPLDVFLGCLSAPWPAPNPNEVEDEDDEDDEDDDLEYE
jgi:hypothetical protein